METYLEKWPSARIINACVKSANEPKAIDVFGVTVRTLNLECLLETKQTSCDKDKLDRVVLERALDELKKR